MKTSVEAYFQRRCMALCALGRAVLTPHHGLAGTTREELVSGFLGEHIPPALSMGSGMVFGYEWRKSPESKGVSRQQGIVIHRHDMPLLRLGRNPMFFVESVVSTIEVKTAYRKQHLKGILDNAASVKEVTEAPTYTAQMGSEGITPRTKSRRILCGVFYFVGPADRALLVKTLNNMLAQRAQNLNKDLPEVPAPDFFYSVQAGLVVRHHEFDTLIGGGPVIDGLDDVQGGLTEEETEPGAYRRVFGDQEGWRGLHTIVLELAERCQRYSVSYTDLSYYV